jgi:hypothetical protein
MDYGERSPFGASVPAIPSQDAGALLYLNNGSALSAIVLSTPLLMCAALSAFN